MKILVATNNQHKVHEYNLMLNPYGIEVVTPKSMGIFEDPVEDGDSYEANSLIKANALAKHTDMPIISDDSGLNVVALNNFPGIYSSRFASENGGNIVANPKLIEMLKPYEDKSAFFTCVITLLNVDEKPVQFKGLCPGYIMDHAEGEGGFGYDPIFFSIKANACFGTAPEEVKDKYSHRAEAVKLLIEYLKEKGLVK